MRVQTEQLCLLHQEQKLLVCTEGHHRGADMPRGACQARPWAHAQQARAGERKSGCHGILLQD